MEKESIKTGIKYANGRDICLGDTVRRTSDWGDFGCEGEVVIDEGRFCIKDSGSGREVLRPLVRSDMWHDMGWSNKINYTYEQVVDGGCCCAPENGGGEPENGGSERERVVLSDFYAPIRDRLMTQTKEQLVEHIVMMTHLNMQAALSDYNKEACRLQDALSRLMKQGQEGGEANDTDGNVHENIAAY